MLLLGGDAGAGRWGLRPDSMTVASIDAETGRTVLVRPAAQHVELPVPPGSVMAKQFPDGCELRDLLPQRRQHLGGGPPRALQRSEHRGVDATIQAIEGITDLRINYWAMVNLEGFRDLVDAVGGVTLNVRAADPRRRARLRRDRLHRAGRASSTATRPSGSPGPARAPTTTRGWPARSA